MEDISDVNIEPLKESQFVKPYRVKFKQNGTPRIWDFVTLHESVYIVIFNTERKKLVLVKQFRPAVYCNSLPHHSIVNNDSVADDDDSIPASEGVTLEFCAGIVDKKLDLKEIAQTEVLEECGYQVPIKNFEKIISCRTGIGVSGEKQTSFYCEVDDSMKVSEGGGLASEGELIEVVEMSIEEAKELMQKPFVNCPTGFLFGLLWFLQNKANAYSC